METAEVYVPLAVAERSGFPESVHFGAAVGLRSDGSIAITAGDPAVLIYPRSSNKPLQAAAMVDLGLQLPPGLLALVCASHDGTPAHVASVRRILALSGLDEAALQNSPSLPLDEQAAQAVIRAGGAPTALLQNCSGKHAGMLATCVVNGWPIQDYTAVDHPLQSAITRTISSFTGERVAHVGIDGCGAPAHALSLVGLARAFRTIATSSPGSPGWLVRAAMTAYPAEVGGDGRDVTAFMRFVPGLVAKDGAEGVFAAAVPDGRAIALKISDGSDRARPPVTVDVLRALGVDVDAVEHHVHQSITGHGVEVGTVRSIARFVQHATASSPEVGPDRTGPDRTAEERIG